MKYNRKTDKYIRQPILQFNLKEEFLREWKSAEEIFKELGFDKSAILRCCKGKQKKSYWYIWKFKNNNNNNDKD
jgi:hypothetical protein